LPALEFGRIEPLRAIKSLVSSPNLAESRVGNRRPSAAEVRPQLEERHLIPLYGPSAQRSLGELHKS
jgi:hypothetical protein